MNIATVATKLRKGRTGRFRRVNTGEPIEEHDIIVGPVWYSEVAESHWGRHAEDKDTILRLEFDK